MQEFLKKQDINPRILLIGPYPPPYGGISSLIRSLVIGFKGKNIQKVVILYFGKFNKIRLTDGAIVYEKSLLKNLWQLIIPFNWVYLPSLITIYSGNNLSFKDYIKILIKTVLTNKLAKEYQINSTSFYQTDPSLHLLLCRKIWGNKRSIVLNVFGELYENKDYLLPKKKLY